MSAFENPVVPCLVALMLAQAACGDPLALPQRIEETRVLAARAEVEERPGFAWPAPGETLGVDWLLVSPEPGLPEVSWRFEACLAVPASSGVARCVAEPFAVVEGSGQPQASFVLPSASDGAPQVAVRGVLCEAGVPAPSGLSCASGQELLTAASVGIAGAELDNTIPELSAAEIFLGEELWLAEASPEPASCGEDPLLPRLRSGSKASLRLALASVVRDELGEERAGFDTVGDRETLQVDWYSTSGRLERASGFIEATDTSAEPELEVAFTAPSVGDARWVRVFFVARDRRGGSSWLTRGLCVVP